MEDKRPSLPPGALERLTLPIKDRQANLDARFMSTVPATWEAEAAGSLEPTSSRAAWATGRDLLSKTKTKNKTPQNNKEKET